MALELPPAATERRLLRRVCAIHGGEIGLLNSILGNLGLLPEVRAKVRLS